MEEYSDYMVIFTLPDELDLKFLSLIPLQRMKVNQLFEDGKLMSYTLSMDRKTLWAVFTTQNEEELIQCIDKLPLTSYMTYEVQALMFNQISKPGLPAISLN